MVGASGSAPDDKATGAAASASGGAGLSVGDRVDGFEVVQVEPDGKRHCFRVRDDRTGAAGMLRLVPAALARHLGSEQFERLLNEARGALAVNTPGVTRLLSVGQRDGTWHLISEEVEGVSAAAHAAAGTADIRTVGLWCAAVADALTGVHAAKLVHRDVRPEHIVIRADGSVCLTGLGVAGLAERLQELRLGKPVASPAYAAPELCRGEPADGRADIYSLGAACHCLLTGAPPYSAETPLKLLQKHGVDPVPDCRAVNPQVPALLAAIIRKAMAAKPSARFPTAALMAGTLRKVLEGVPGSEAAAGTAEPSLESFFESPAAVEAAAPAPEPVLLPERPRSTAAVAAISGAAGSAGGSKAKWMLAAAAVLVLLVGGYLVFRGGRPPDSPGDRAAGGGGRVEPGETKDSGKDPGGAEDPSGRRAAVFDFTGFDRVRGAAKARWIWFPEGDPTKDAPKETRWFRRVIDVPAVAAGEPAPRAAVEVFADNRFEMFVNGRSVGQGEDWQRAVRIDLTRHLLNGRNVLAVRATNDGGPAGLCIAGVVRAADRNEIIRSAGDWKASQKEHPGWMTADFDDAAWPAAKELAEFGAAGAWATAGRYPDAAIHAWMPGWRAASLTSHELPKVLPEYGGRNHVLATHPEERDRPAAIECVLDLAAGKSCGLSVWVTGHVRSDKADWLFRAFVNGVKVRELTVQRLAAGWQYVVIDLSPYAGKRVTVRLENAAGGKEIWDNEFGYWADLRIDERPAAGPGGK